MGKRKQDSERNLLRSSSPKSVLCSSRSHCKLHCRDYSDCIKFHANYARAGIDPFQRIGQDVLPLIMKRLDARSLARCGLVCKHWRHIAHSDDLWIDKCVSLWFGKQCIPPAALVPGLPRIAAYGLSILDSERAAITREELCQQVWEFRFKDVAPQYWLNLDPSRRGRPPMKRYFHPDGSQTAGSEDNVWGGHESSFVLIDEDTPNGPARHVRINHWPKMVISRTEDWGWELQNQYYVYRSIAHL